MYIIEVSNLNKSYGSVDAVKGASFSVQRGEIFGLLGPNGAGKTTTMEILEGLKIPDSGSVKILGMDISKNIEQIRKKTGVVLQSTSFLPYLTLAELLRLFAAIYGQEHDRELVQRFALREILHKEFASLSGGQKQRFVLATALVHHPEVLFLDEPTIGLDPGVRQKFWDIILELRSKGLTIMLTTHYMEEAQILCDRVAIIDQGKIIASDRPVRLINSLGVISHIRFMSSKPVNVATLESISGVLSARRDKYIYDLESDSPEISLRQLMDWEKGYEGKIFNLQVQQATLEDVFLKLTGRSLRK